MNLLAESTFQAFCDLIADEIGVRLGPDKKDFLVGRLRPCMMALEIDSYEEYLDLIGRLESVRERALFVDAVTTHHTFFFREERHLKKVAEHIDDVLSTPGKSVRIWSAACSTGEEPYSLAIQLHEELGAERFGFSDLRILATDISKPAVHDAEKGVYPDTRLASVCSSRVEDYFSLSPDRTDAVVAKKLLKDKIAFRTLNLLDPKYPFRGPFDAIVCRNVLIYFSEALRQQLVERFVSLLRPGGLLIVGMSESVQNAHDELSYVEPAVYQRKGGVSQSSREAVASGYRGGGSLGGLQ